MSTTLAVANGPPGTSLAASQGINAVRETMDTLKAIRTFVKEEMVPNLDFGIIPGTGQKPALLQPGAQKTALYFNATPDHGVEKTELGNGHVEFLITTRLVSRTTGAVIGMGLGSCSTMEKKYRYRHGDRVCPKCGAPAILASKEAGRGFFCWKKKGGCGATFREGDPEITGQRVGQVDNPDVYDARNTVLKMAVKRSFVAAALSLGCLSELFTQDIDETYDLAGQAPPADDRDHDRDDRRRQVNEAFQPRGRERPQGRSGATPAHVDEDQGGMPQARPESWAAYVARVCTERRDYWHSEMTINSVPKADRERAEFQMPNQYEVTNHFVNLALEKGTVQPEAVTVDGKRDQSKAKSVMADIFRRSPRKVMAAVEDYFAEKERGIRVKLGMDDPEVTDGHDETAPQEPEGREPGSDDDR